MNILLLGTPDSVFVRNYCVYVLSAEETNTVILAQAAGKQYRQDYEKNHVKVVEWPDFFIQGIRKQLPMLPLVFKKWHDLKKEIGFGNKIDVLHVHYVEPLQLIYFSPFWKKAEKRILTFWGSDILCASKRKLSLFPYFLKSATSIVFMIQNQCDYFQMVFGHKYDDKIRIIDFGNSLLGVLDDVMQKYSIAECKKHFHLPVDKVIVHVGYNAFKEQQHAEILEGMIIQHSDALCKLKLVFHVSYGQGTDFEEYKQHLEKIMDKADLDYVFVDKYLQGEELAMFRRTCDIFIYGQKTDARSASPLEYIYAGAKFVCPKWLSDNYKLLDEANIEYYIYDDFKGLSKEIQLCLNDLALQEKEISEQGRKRIRNEISWEALSEKWRSLYE